MPNWCSNVLTIDGRRGVLACLDHIRGDRNIHGYAPSIDLNKIVPMPDVLKGSESGSEVDCGLALFDDNYAQKLLVFYRKDLDIDALRANIRVQCTTAIEKGQKAIQLIQETGYPNWYEWSIAKWGCKWNACDCGGPSNPRDTYAVIQFETPGDPPFKAILALSEQYRELRFALEYVREYYPSRYLSITDGEVLANTRFNVAFDEQSSCPFNMPTT